MSSPSSDDSAMRLWAPVKLIAWTLLSAAITLHALQRRHIRSRGWQLNRVIVCLCWLFTGAACAEMAIVFGGREIPSRAVYISFFTVADAFFLGLLMAISVGFCITRADLGPNRGIIIAAPLVYFLASVTVDSIALGETARKHGPLTGAASAALVACGVLLRLASILVAWAFVHTSVREERSRLAARAAQLSDADVFKLEEAEDGRDQSQRAAQGVIAAARLSIPRSADAISARSMAVSSSIVAGAATSVGEAADIGGPERVKSALLRGFQRGVTMYAVFVAITTLLGLASSQWADVTAAAQGAARWAFMLSLAMLFRPRDDNPYLLLVDEYRFDSPSAAPAVAVPHHLSPPQSGPPSPSTWGDDHAAGAGRSRADALIAHAAKTETAI
jgi:hypothetical protein